MKRALKRISFFVSILLIVCFTFKYTGLKLSLPIQKNKADSSQKTSTRKKKQEKSIAKANINTTPQVREIKTIDALLAILTRKEPTVIMGTMDHCHFCKKAEPIFKSYPAQFPNIDFFTANGPKTNMGQLVYKETDNKVAIRGYPAFLFIKDGKIQDHLLGTNIEKLESKLNSL